MVTPHRLGLIVPSSNTAAEADFHRFLPDSVSLHTARMYLATTTADCEREMLEAHAPRAAIDLGTAKPAVVVFSCTSAGGLLGVEGEAELERRLGLSAGAPVVSTNAAVAWRLSVLGARRILVVTAYLDELNVGIEKSLSERGFDVARITGLGLTDNFAIADVPAEEIMALVRRELAQASGAVDTVFISCTNLRAAETADRLAAELGIPVVTSNLAAIDKALDTLGLATTAIGVP